MSFHGFTLRMICVHPLVGVAIHDIQASLLVVIIGYSVPSHSMMLLCQLLFVIGLQLLHVLGCYTIAIYVNSLYFGRQLCPAHLYLIFAICIYLDCSIYFCPLNME